MKVSIAMATYNGANYLQEQLVSFAAQTRCPDELIVCDDCSNDETVLIIEEFSRVSPFPVRLIKNSFNLGFVKNFEKAIALCTGELIFLSDQDDVWFPEKVEYIENVFLKGDGKLLLIHDGQLVDENLQWHGATKLGQIRAGWGNDQEFITGALSVIHSNLKASVLPFPSSIAVGHDAWIHLIANSLGCRQVVEHQLQLIRRHTSNTSQWVASSVTKINKLDAYQSQFSTTPANSYADRIYLNQTMTDRLRSIHIERPKDYPLHVITASLKYLKDERLALEHREKLLKAGFLARRVAALRMLVLREYKYFNGVRSFLRDMSRSQ